MPLATLQQYGEWMANAMNIFADVNSSGTEVLQHFFKRHLLLFRMMTAIIDQHVNSRHCAPKSFPKSTIGLVSDVNRGVRILIRLAYLLDIHSMYPTAVAKVVSTSAYCHRCTPRSLQQRLHSQRTCVGAGDRVRIPHTGPFIDSIKICL